MLLPAEMAWRLGVTPRYLADKTRAGFFVAFNFGRKTGGKIRYHWQTNVAMAQRRAGVPNEIIAVLGCQAQSPKPNVQSRRK